MKKLSNLFIFLTSAFFALATFSCSNLENDENNKVSSAVAISEEAYITFGKTSARTVTPSVTDDDFSSLVLTGAKSGESESELASWENISEMQSAKVAVSTGTWTFTLTATAGGSTYIGSIETPISTGENALSFTLSLSDFGTETGAFEITVSYADTGNASSVSYATATLENTDGTSISSETLTASDNSVTYSASEIAAGTYRIRIIFYSSSENNGGFAIATYRELVQISSGLTSKVSRTLESFDVLYAITYNLNNGNLADGETAQETFTRKTSVTLPAVVRTGYTFSGWTDEDSKPIGTLEASDGKTSYGWSAGTYTENVTLTAQWTGNTYTVTFNANGGTDDDTTQEFTYGTSAALNANTFTRAGYTFTGWATSYDSENATYLDKATYTTPASNITLYAVWEANTDTTYKVKHFLQPVSLSTTLSDYVEQTDDEENKTGTTDTTTLATAKSYTGFTAQTITQGTIAGDGSTVISVYYDRNTITFILNLDGGSGTESLIGKYGTRVIAPGNPARTGYTFSSWSPEIPETFPAEDVEFTANWTPNTDTKYTVYHYQQNANDDKYTLKETDNLTGITATETAAEAKSYEHFTAQCLSQAEIAADGSTVIRVYYDREIITFTLNLDGGTLAGETGTIVQTGKYGQTVSLDDPTRIGYSFEGWNSIGSTIAAIFETDTTYTALWTANSVGITASAPAYSDSDLGLSYTTYTTKITLKAKSGYSSYSWYVDGLKKKSSTSNTFTMSIDDYDAGSYTVMLVVGKSSAIVEVAVSK